MMRPSFLAALMIPSIVCAAARPVVTGADEIARRLDGRFRRIQTLRPRMGVRELFGFALEAAGSASHLDHVERVLELAEKMHDRNPKSRTYGNFKWYWESDAPHDRNAVQFSMQQATLLWMHFRDRLTPKAAERLDRLMRLSIEGIRRHNVREAYTNIFLMKTWNCVALGELLGMADLAREGHQMLDRWLVYTWDHGIHEYLSPTYYGVDLDSLALLAKFACREQTRRAAEAALELFWTDIAANWFAPAGRLGGAHSRDYDYLTGRGYLHNHIRPLGWLPHETHRPSVFQQLCAWGPPKETLKRVGGVPRVVRQRWGAGVGDRATHYVDRRFSIGSAGANYGPMDKPLTVNLAGGWKMPVASFLMDARGDPYGRKRFAMSPGGHHKALHIQPFLTSVQQTSQVLLLAHADPADRMFKRRAPEPTCLLSHLVFPAKVAVSIDGKPVSLAKDQQAPVPPGASVFLRFEDVAIAIRVVLALDTAGRPAPVAIVNDGSFDAMRLTVTHAAAAPTAPGTVALFVDAKEGLDDAGFARFRTRFAHAKPLVKIDGHVVEVAATGSSGAMRLRANLATRQRLMIAGHPRGAQDLLLGVNGFDYGRQILRRVPAVARYERVLDAARRGEKGSARAEEVFEAEVAAFIAAPFRSDEAKGASGGKFLWMPGEPGGKGGSSVARALYLVNVPKAASYTLWGRIQAPTPSDDSFYVRIRQGRSEIVAPTDWHTGTHKTWEWAALTRGSTREPVAIPLAAGVALLEIRCREDGTRLDALFLTAKPGARPPEDKAD